MLAKTIYKGLALALLAVALSPFSSWAQEYGFSPVTGQVTSNFGWRTDPITGGPRFHGGLDIAAPQGSPVYAPQAGVVVYSGAYGGYGNVVVLNHGNTLYTVYGHNSRLLVNRGDTVYRGQVISLVGSTGRSTGPHLHFEVHYKQQYLNPMSYMVYVQHTEGMLAQATQRPAVQSYANSAGVDSSVVDSSAVGAMPARTVRRQNGSRSARGNQSVQVLNGSNDVETVEF